MARMVVVRAAKKVRMINNNNVLNVVSIVVAEAVSMILVAVSIVVHVKRVAMLAKVVTVSSKAVVRKMSVTEDKIVMVLDATSVATSVVVEVMEEEEEAVVVVVVEEEEEEEDVHATKMVVTVDHKRMDKMVNNEVHQDVAILVSVVRCVGSKMAMLMVLR